ncbi:bidirectional sugar transporter SWEET4 [Ricinus communis]|uniref:Bidirectional sugar transporter SWEET n=1 Tax=Ricinus communis TaxID=3988 RepID=B9RUU5_RICCO|nr:bidirectional sugar transporter SWEET4 [Ricinus communis]EEF44888.1 conserved hypothetical protein [Ricinus communis]|eukprot:XP_002517346.1 bidirectional sugar transporter SWEET4 [Ricinus communis]
MVNARTIVGIVGNIISFCLFLSPLPTFYRIIKKKDVEEFQFYPYVATVLNCMLWMFYGLPIVKEDSLLVVTINSIGLVIELVYLGIYCFYDNQNKGRKKVGLCLLGEVGFMAVIIAIAMLAFHKLKYRSLFVGVFCDILNVMMYSSPLLIMKKVIMTKSVEYMPFPLSLAGFLNGACWTAFAIIKLDLFILISNGLGTLAGAFQLIIFFRYYRWCAPKQTDDDDIVKPSEIQLSGANAASRV